VSIAQQFGVCEHVANFRSVDNSLALREPEQSVTRTLTEPEWIDTDGIAITYVHTQPNGAANLTATNAHTYGMSGR
jgi:hypothetical protein